MHPYRLRCGSFKHIEGNKYVRCSRKEEHPMPHRASNYEWIKGDYIY